MFLTDAAVTNLQNWVAARRRRAGLLARLADGAGQPAAGPAAAGEVDAGPRGALPDEAHRPGPDLHWLGEGGAGDAQLAGLPTLASDAQVDRSKPLAVVLATGGRARRRGARARPSSTSRTARGRVVVIEGAGMWRWAFLPPQYQQQEEVYASLWHSLLALAHLRRGLLPGQKLALRADKVSFATGEPATATLLVREEAGEGQRRAGCGVDRPRLKDAKSFTAVAARARSPAASASTSASSRRPLPGAGGRRRNRGRSTPGGVRRAGVRPRATGPPGPPRPDGPHRRRQRRRGPGADPAGEVADRFQEHLAAHPPAAVRADHGVGPAVGPARVFAVWVAAWAVRRAGGWCEGDRESSVQGQCGPIDAVGTDVRIAGRTVGRSDGRWNFVKHHPRPAPKRV